LAPLFVAVAGTNASVSVMDSMQMLGPDMSRARLRHAQELVGSLGKKKLKKMQQNYAKLI
jgi:glutamyl-tRNA synthetase